VEQKKEEKTEAPKPAAEKKENTLAEVSNSNKSPI